MTSTSYKGPQEKLIAMALLINYASSIAKLTTKPMAKQFNAARRKFGWRAKVSV